MMELDMEKAKEVQGYRETAIEMINKIPEDKVVFVLDILKNVSGILGIDIADE